MSRLFILGSSACLPPVPYKQQTISHCRRFIKRLYYRFKVLYALKNASRAIWREVMLKSMLCGSTKLFAMKAVYAHRAYTLNTANRSVGKSLLDSYTIHAIFLRCRYQPHAPLNNAHFWWVLRLTCDSRAALRICD